VGSSNITNGADHRPALGFFHEPVFDAHFDIANAEGSRTRATGENCSRGNNDVQVQVGESAPIELHGGALRIHLNRRSVRGGEGIEFVIAKSDRLGIVGLKRRAAPRGYRQQTQAALPSSSLTINTDRAIASPWERARITSY
jgi:hypothetical protein